VVDNRQFKSSAILARYIPYSRTIIISIL